MLKSLRTLHSDILTQLDVLEAVTAEPQPPMQRLTAVRYNLTRASRGRTVLLEKLYPQLIARASDARRPALEALRIAGKEILMQSAGHISSWTLREVERRWPEYCAASRTMRAAMRRRVAEEQELVYPLLAEDAARPA